MRDRKRSHWATGAVVDLKGAHGLLNLGPGAGHGGGARRRQTAPATIGDDAEVVLANRLAARVRKTEGNLDVVALDLGGDRSLADDGTGIFQSKGHHCPLK